MSWDQEILRLKRGYILTACLQARIIQTHTGSAHGEYMQIQLDVIGTLDLPSCPSASTSTEIFKSELLMELPQDNGITSPCLDRAIIIEDSSMVSK